MTRFRPDASLGRVGGVRGFLTPLSARRRQDGQGVSIRFHCGTPIPGETTLPGRRFDQRRCSVRGPVAVVRDGERLLPPRIRVLRKGDHPIPGACISHAIRHSLPHAARRSFPHAAKRASRRTTRHVSFPFFMFQGTTHGFSSRWMIRLMPAGRQASRRMAGDAIPAPRTIPFAIQTEGENHARMIRRSVVTRTPGSGSGPRTGARSRRN